MLQRTDSSEELKQVDPAEWRMHSNLREIEYQRSVRNLSNQFDVFLVTMERVELDRRRTWFHANRNDILRSLRALAPSEQDTTEMPCISAPRHEPITEGMAKITNKLTYTTSPLEEDLDKTQPALRIVRPIALPEKPSFRWKMVEDKHADAYTLAERVTDCYLTSYGERPKRLCLSEENHHYLTLSGEKTYHSIELYINANLSDSTMVADSGD